MSEQSSKAIMVPPWEDPVLAECDYYQGVGTCSFGCYQEPACLELGPGVEPDWHPVKVANMRGRRIGHRTRTWLGYLRMAMWTWEREHPGEPHTWKGEDLTLLRRAPKQNASHGLDGDGEA